MLTIKNALGQATESGCERLRTINRELVEQERTTRDLPNLIAPRWEGGIEGDDSRWEGRREGDDGRWEGHSGEPRFFNLKSREGMSHAFEV